MTVGWELEAVVPAAPPPADVLRHGPSPVSTSCPLGSSRADRVHFVSTMLRTGCSRKEAVQMPASLPADLLVSEGRSVLDAHAGAAH